MATRRESKENEQFGIMMCIGTTGKEQRELMRIHMTVNTDIYSKGCAHEGMPIVDIREHHNIKNGHDQDKNICSI